ncbi:hypothetical protein [Thiomicrorhabdus heinhorstiae]|uniref:Porin n=1 Tax=Thiomicrorhabdus heinhorstiae TaxID=2748010 RepID=A0ABS0BX17_9GAMM|nr:hypothetical protein [Thiomicrorhabdus heinhorstiae]MBF6057539.1 hypothetical protein [Thiomicrorhabdus heinhorstiae]
MKLRNILFTSLLLCISSSPQAHEDLEELSVKGFVSQAYFKSTDNPYATNATLNEGGSFNFRELGLNLNWEVNHELRFATQVLSRQYGNVSNGSPIFDLALIDYSPVHTLNEIAGIRIGRVKTPYGIYNDSRDLPSTRPGVLLPSIYFENLRDLMLSTDGGSLYFEQDNDHGHLAVNVYAGQRDLEDKSLEYKQFYADIPGGDFKKLNKQGLKVEWSPFSLPGLSFAYSMLNWDTDLVFSTPFPLSSQYYTGTVNSTKLKTLHHLLSAQYQLRSLTFTAEWMKADGSLNVKGSSGTGKVNIESEGYFLQAEWTPVPRLTGLLRYEAYKPYKNHSSIDSNAITLAGRWYFNPQWLLTSQYSWHEGIADIPTYEGIDFSNLQESWALFALQLTYQF